MICSGRKATLMRANGTSTSLSGARCVEKHTNATSMSTALPRTNSFSFRMTGCVAQVSRRQAPMRIGLPLGSPYEALTTPLLAGGTLLKERLTEVLLELVPTPDNPFDSCAIAVELDGKKLGNLGSGYSRYAHWKLRQLNHHGFRLFTAGVYRAFYRDEIREVTPEAFISIPTLDDLDLKLRALAAKRSDFRRLWNALDSELQDQIREDHFHLTDETAARIIGYSHQFPELTLPTQPDTSAIPRELDLVLRDVRLEEAESKRLLRQAEHEARWIEDCNQVAELVLKAFTRKEISERLSIPFGRVSRAIRAMNLQEMATIHQPSRIAEERKDEVLKRAADGQSNAQIEREMNLGKGRCSKIWLSADLLEPVARLEESAITTYNSCASVEMGQRALELHLAGFTGKEIAAEIGVAEPAQTTRGRALFVTR